MSKVNDDVLSRIAEDYGNFKMVPAGETSSVLSVEVEAEEYRRDLVFIRDKVAVQITDVEILWFIEIPKETDLELVNLAWFNAQPGAQLLLEMFVLPRPPVTSEFRQLVGRAIVNAVDLDVVVGPIVSSVASRSEQRPTSIRGFAGTFMIFRGTKVGGGTLEVGTQFQEATFIKKPATRQWFRKTDLTTFVSA